MFQRQRDPRLNEILFPFFDLKRAKQIIDAHEPNDEARLQGMWDAFHSQDLFLNILKMNNVCACDTVMFLCFLWLYIMRWTFYSAVDFISCIRYWLLS